MHGNDKHKLPTTTPVPKQTSILGFLSRGNGSSHSSGGGATSNRSSAPTSSILPPSVPSATSRYAPRPGSNITVPQNVGGSIGAGPPSTPASVPIPPPSVALSPSASLVPVSESHIPTLKTLNQLTLPVQYSDKFYAATLSSDPFGSGVYSRVILVHPCPSSSTSFSPEGPINSNPDPVMAGAVVCRVEISPFRLTRSPGELALYIQSLALFSPYRGAGLMTLAIAEIIRYAASNPPPYPSTGEEEATAATGEAKTATRITDAYVHVWTENLDALDWYSARGFEKVDEEPIEGYYYRLLPSTAWVLRRKIKVGDLLSLSSLPSTTISHQLDKYDGRSKKKNVNHNNNNTNNDNHQHHHQDGENIESNKKKKLAHFSSSPHATTSTTITTGPGLSVAPPRSALLVSPSAPPPRTFASSSSSSPGIVAIRSKSFQNHRPGTEWNDLPADMVASNGTGTSNNGLVPYGNTISSSSTTATGVGSSAGGGTQISLVPSSSVASSRSSSAVRKKKAREYPDAAFQT